MNNEIRKTISGYQSRLSEIRNAIDTLKDDLESEAPTTNLATVGEQMKTWAGDISDLGSAIKEIGDEEQEKYDNMPESLQQGDRGQAMEAAASAAEEAESAATEACSALEDVTEFTVENVVAALESAITSIEELDSHMDTVAE